MSISRANDAWKRLATARRDREDGRSTPVRSGGSVESVRFVQVVGGNSNLLAPANRDGIGFDGAISEVPAAVPTDPTACDDGLGYGYLDDDVTDLVWVCNCPLTDIDATVHTPLLNVDLVAGIYVYLQGPYQVQIAGEAAGVTAAVWLAWRI